MIRFVDLTAAYWSHPDHGGPCCAFLDTRTDTFVANDFGPVFDSLDEVRAIPDVGERCAGLVPDRFFEKMSTRPAALSAEFITDSFGTTSWSVGFFWKGDEPHKYFFLNDLTEAEAKRCAADLNIAAAGKADVATQELLADNERLRALLAGDMLKVSSIQFPDPQGDLAVQFGEHWVLQLLVHHMGAIVKEAPNYVEIRADHEEHGALTLTIQRRDGKTPHEKRVEAEARADALQKRLDMALTADLRDSDTLRRITPEMANAYLKAHGWREESCPAGTNWCPDGDYDEEVTVPHGDLFEYPRILLNILAYISKVEKRTPLAVYLDMLDTAQGAG